jgi:hypothetical protein
MARPSIDCPIGFVSLGSTADIEQAGRRSTGDDGVGISTEVVGASVIGTSETVVEPSLLVLDEPPHPAKKPTTTAPTPKHRTH